MSHTTEVKETRAILTEEELMLLELLEKKKRITIYHGKKNVIAEVKETCAMLTNDKRMLLKLLVKKQRITSYQGKKSVTRYAFNSAIYVDSTKYTHDMCSLGFIPIIRSRT
jgi:hypothetical protein